jgi:hypothetical protein
MAGVAAVVENQFFHFEDIKKRAKTRSDAIG